MKFLNLVLVALLVSTNALAYVSLQGNDPNLGSYDSEYKSAVKSETALYSDAISKGQALYYSETELTGLFKVSRFNAADAMSATASFYIACVAGRSVATGDTAAFPCINRGYATAYYDATSAIFVGNYLCIGTAATVKGKFINCGAGVTGKVRALEAKASGSGTDLKVKIIGE